MDKGIYSKYLLERISDALQFAIMRAYCVLIHFKNLPDTAIYV